MNKPIKIDNLRETQGTLDRLPRQAARDLGNAVADWAAQVTRDSRMRATTRQQRLAARSLTQSGAGDTQMITGGGSARLPNGNGTYGDVFFGAEFGGGGRPRTRQFLPYRSRGYWFWPSLYSDRHNDRMERVLDDVEQNWRRG